MSRFAWRIPFEAEAIAAKAREKALPLRKEIAEKKPKLDALRRELARMKVTTENLHHASDEHRVLFEDANRIEGTLRQNESELDELEYFIRVLSGKKVQLELDRSDISFFGLDKS